MITKFASYEVSEVLDVKGSPTRLRTASLDKLADYENYRTSDGYLYARIRAISSRVNKNHDGWPSVELAGSKEIFDRHHSGSGFTVEAADGNKDRGFSTFIGKPIFVDHHNSDPKKARGVIVDAKLNVLDHRTASKDDDYWGGSDIDSEHMPPTEVELLLEVDADSFPKLAEAIVSNDLDGFSMGCFVAGTPITLADGTKLPIEEIAIGDQVLTHTGKVEQVTHLMSHQYNGTTFTVHSFGQAQPVTATEEHPFWTKDGWTEAKNLKIGNWVFTPTIQGVDQPGEYRFARLLGYYLAEGNLGYDHKRYPDRRPVFVEWNFSVDEIDTLVKDTQILLTDLGYKSCGPYVKNHCATVRVNSPELAQRFFDYGNQHSWGKRLSSEVLQWEPANQKELLNAYFNGDGHFGDSLKRHVEVGTASPHLASQLQLLATRVGYRMTPPVKQHSPSAQHKRAKYNMQATLGEPDARTNHGMELVEGGLWRKVTKIEENAYSDLVYNFDVEGDDSYVAGDIAVHNCDVEYSKCSHCGHEASSPDQYCSHIMMKGAHHDYKTADGKKTSKKSYENCYGIHFFEISAVFDPADATARSREIKSSVNKESDLYGNPELAEVGADDPARPASRDLAIEQHAIQMMQQYKMPYEKAMEMANNAAERTQRPPGAGDGRVYSPKMVDYAPSDSYGLPKGSPPPINPNQDMTGINPGFFDAAQEELNAKYPKRPIQNDPRWSSQHTAENPLPQSFETHAPDEVDTLREEQMCPICGNDMESETCEVCGYVQPPKEFDNPDLNKAEEIRDEMKQKDEEAATPQDQPGQAPTQPGTPPAGASQGQGPLTGPASNTATKPPATAHLKSDMSWTPLVHPKTAARINQVEVPVTPSNRPASNEPKKETVTSDQTRPVTAAMQTAQQLMARAQRNHTGESMNRRTADGPTPPGDTAADKRVNVTDVGGIMDATNEQASKIDTTTTDVTGIGGVGLNDVSADKTESLPAAGRDSDDSGFNTDKTTDDSGPTKTFGDTDGQQHGTTDPVTDKTPYWTEESKWEKATSRQAGDDTTLEQQEQQGNKPVAQGGSAVKGVQPVSETFGERVNLLEHKTSPENNSGPTSQWTGTGGNGVTQQVDPVTKDKQEWGGVPVPDVKLHTNARAHFFAALRLAEAEEELGLISRDEKYPRIAALENESPESIKAQLSSLARVKTAGLAKLTQQRQAGVRRLPAAFGKQTAAPNGFERIASDTPAERQVVDNSILDAGLFSR